MFSKKFKIMDYKTFFTNRSTIEISKDLLGRKLTFFDGKENLGGYIVETEAYLGKNDRAAHSYGGHRSPANEGLYKEGGTLYIYSRRQYFFFDVACQEEGEPQGVLVRAIEPEFGIDRMVKNRGSKTGPLLTNGPGKMMQALGIHSRKWDLHKLSDSPFSIDINHKKSIQEIDSTPRIGIKQDDPFWAKEPLRFIVSGNPYVSGIKKREIRPNDGWK